MKDASDTIAGLHDGGVSEQIPEQDIHVDDYDDEHHTESITTGARRMVARGWFCQLDMAPR